MTQRDWRCTVAILLMALIVFTYTGLLLYVAVNV